MRFSRLLFFSLLLSIYVPPAHARITEINVQKVEPFAGRVAFGKAGSYKRVWGAARGKYCQFSGNGRMYAGFQGNMLPPNRA